MTQMIEAIYENGVLRPLTPLALPENARVRLSVADLSVADLSGAVPAGAGSAGSYPVVDGPRDGESAQWHVQSERALMKVWDNDGDEIFNDLLAP